ncbi:MAG TPA: hypothetical protein VF529_09780 [Solirubrobacteraceae bacterium]
MRGKIAPPGGSSPSSAESRANRQSNATLLALIMGVGLVMVVVSHEAFDGGIPAELVGALGEAMVVAGLLGVTVDFFFKKELARDAFEAGLGYVLPVAMRGELSWMVGQQLLCVEFDQHFTLRPDGDDCLILSVDVYRRVQNIGSKKVDYEPPFELDEWFETGDSANQSEIGSVEFFRGNAPLERELKTIRKGHTVEAKVEGMTLAPGEVVRVRCAGREIKRRNGSCSQTVTTPVVRPTVSVESCDDIDVDVQFGNCGECVRIGDRWQLQSTLLPHQVITVRWWERSKVGPAGDPGENGPQAVAAGPAAGDNGAPI